MSSRYYFARNQVIKAFIGEHKHLEWYECPAFLTRRTRLLNRFTFGRRPEPAEEFAPRLRFGAIARAWRRTILAHGYCWPEVLAIRECVQRPGAYQVFCRSPWTLRIELFGVFDLGGGELMVDQFNPLPAALLDGFDWRNVDGGPVPLGEGVQEPRRECNGRPRVRGSFHSAMRTGAERREISLESAALA